MNFTGESEERVRYLIGDATRPIPRPAIVAHVCNDAGGWGRGFVLAVSRQWPGPSGPESAYRAWCARGGRLRSKSSGSGPEETGSFGLGQSQLVNVGPGLFVLNMVAQHGLASAGGLPPIRYDALALCLRQADAFAKKLGASLHMPRIGCGLAGGSWKVVGGLVGRLTSVPVSVYDLPGAS